MPDTQHEKPTEKIFRWLFITFESCYNNDINSIVSTAQVNGLDAEKYLTELFRQPARTIIPPWIEENNGDT